MTPERATAPDGYQFFGWHGYTSASLSASSVDSVAHYADVDQGDRPYLAACGVRMRGRGKKRDRPQDVAWDVGRGTRQVCKRCQAALKR